MDPLSISASIITTIATARLVLEQLNSFNKNVLSANPVASLWQTISSTVELLELTVIALQKSDLPNEEPSKLLTRTVADIHTVVKSLSAEALKFVELDYGQQQKRWDKKRGYTQREIRKLMEYQHCLSRELLLISPQKVQVSITDVCQPMSRHISVMDIDHEKISTADTESIKYDSSRGGSECLTNCPCKCHERHLACTPWWLGPATGYMHVSYRLGLSCNRNLCNRRSSPLASIFYLFPMWSIRRAIYLSTENSHLGFNLSLHFLRILENTSPALACISKSDIPGLQNLFQLRDVSPFDVDERGDALLHIATREGQLGVCKFLVNLGADPYQLNTNNRSAADLAWDIVLSGSEDSTLLTYMDPRNFALKGRGFSRAHLLVLGLTTQDSRDIYEIEPSLVDIADVDGRTPLYWAIRRKDIVAAQLLLQHGANPNAGVSALPWACKDRYQSVDVLAAILQYGADPDATDEDGYIALQACGIYGRSRDFTKTLVSHGASIDAPYEGRYSLYNGITPLGFSAFYTHLGTLGDLLYDGANVNHQDHQGRTPLHLAVQSHERSEITVKCVRRLLDAGVDTTIRDHKGYTATNLAMSVQDIECLQLLLAAGVDPSPPFSDPSERSNAFLVLKWALENGWKESATFFLSKVSLYDLDPRTGDDVLQIVARFGNRRVLETLESAFFALPYLDEFSTDVNDYEINTELRQDSQFEGLLSRMKDRIEEDSRASRESEEHHVDEAISIFADLDDEPLSVNEKLHENAKPAGNFDRGDLDSGYATDSSDYFHRSEGNQTAQNIDMGKLRLRLGRDSTDDLKSIENKPRKEPTMIGYKVIYSIVMLGILLLEFWRTATNLSSSIRKALNVWLRRRPKPGHTRISWTCWCGKGIYADFPSSIPGRLKRLSDALNTTTAQQTQSSAINASLNGELQSPPAAHIRTSSACSHTNASNVNLSFGDNATISPTPTASNNQTVTPRYLELCINTGKLCQSLGEIELTRVTSDHTLFAWIRKRYREVRGPHRHWTHYLIKPVAMRFVYFGLENKKKVHIFRPHGAYPSEDDIKSNQWQSVLCPPEPPPPMPSDTFIHYLCYCEEKPTTATGSRVWLERLPKKMVDSLLSGSEPLVHGYGLHIIEGINITAVLWTLFCVLAVCLGPLIAYVVLKKDVQAATGAGGLAVSVLTLVWMAAKVSECGER